MLECPLELTISSSDIPAFMYSNWFLLQMPNGYLMSAIVSWIILWFAVTLGTFSIPWHNFKWSIFKKNNPACHNNRKMILYGTLQLLQLDCRTRAVVRQIKFHKNDCHKTILQKVRNQWSNTSVPNAWGLASKPSSTNILTTLSPIR